LVVFNELTASLPFRPVGLFLPIPHHYSDKHFIFFGNLSFPVRLLWPEYLSSSLSRFPVVYESSSIYAHI
jgi:hypothetical protein